MEKVPSRKIFSPYNETPYERTIMNPRLATKTAVRFLARGGTASAVGNIVASNRSVSDNDTVDLYHKSAAYVGGFAAGWIVGDYVGAFAAVKVDEAFDWINKTFNKAL